MSFLLHIDSSIKREGSVSKELTAHFAEQWRATNPDGRYVHRDFGVDPLPHLTHEVREHLIDPEGRDHGTTEEQRALCADLLAEVRESSIIVIGAPMHNYLIPSSLKVWLDIVVHPSFMIQPGQTGVLSGKPVIVAAARGGSYAPGTPRESFNFQEPYLKAVLGSIGLADDLTFLKAEMTLSYIAPPLAKFQHIAERTKAEALETLQELATATPVR